MKKTFLRSITLLLSLLFFLTGQAVGKQYPLWEAGIGGVSLYMPDYRGSDESRIYVYPFPYIIYRGDRLKIDRENIRGLFFKTDRLKLDFSLNGNVPVDSTKNKARQGMPSLNPTFEVGPSLEVLLTENKTKGFKTTLTIPVRAVFSTDFIRIFPEGWTFSPRINFDLFEKVPAKGWNVGAGFGPVFADRTFHEYYYRVDRAYATTERPSYSPSGGYGGLQLTTYVGKNFNKFRINLFARADLLNGAAFSDSPLVKNNLTFLAGFSISYFLMESQSRVEADR